MTIETSKAAGGGSPVLGPEDTTRPPASELGADKYLPYLADLDMTDAQKRAFLGELSGILRHFVELAFDRSEGAPDGVASFPSPTSEASPQDDRKEDLD